MKTHYLSVAILLVASLSVKAQIFGKNKWQQGTYYTPEGKKINGLISLFPHEKAPDKSEDYILFKSDSVAVQQWIPSSSLKSFTVKLGKSKIDSFTVGKETFIDVMCMAMADNPEVVKAIKKKQYNLDSINDLIEFYNSGGTKPPRENKKDDAY